jgi:hypothetical protein
MLSGEFAGCREYKVEMVQQLFTLMCDFDGGTYLAQVQASDEQIALSEWAKILRRDQPIPTVSVLVANCVIDDLCLPAPVSGLTGVWCWTGSVNNKLVVTNIVRSS